MSLEVLRDGPLDHAPSRVNDKVIFYRSPRRIGFGIIKETYFPRPHEVDIGMNDHFFLVLPDGEDHSILLPQDHIVTLY